MTVTVPLRALIVEDSPDDAELILLELRRAGYAITSIRVETAEDLRAALARDNWDVVIADYNMPRFSGAGALAMVRAHDPDLPLILVSGTVGDEEVVELLRIGARDYVAKSRLTRLATSVERELREFETRVARRRAEFALRFIADASQLLGQSLEHEENLAQVAAYAVPVYADACVVALLDGERLQIVASVHADATKNEKLARDATTLTEVAVRSATPLVVPDINTAPLGPEAVARLSSLDLASVLSVPILVAGEVAGAIGFGRGALHRFDAVDAATAENLAHRAGLAVHNARLFRSAREAVRKRDEFLAIAAHELRTPLTPLLLQMNSIEGLLRMNGDDAMLHRRLCARIEIAARQANRLVKLVETLLDTSRLMRDRFELEPGLVYLGTVVRDVAERFALDAARSGSTIAVHAPRGVEGVWDSTRLDQVITNLLSNAIRYGKGNPIEVRLEDRGDVALIVVRDRGIGISPEDRVRVFERFERAVSGRHYGGLGIGLWIARRIVETHGGSIEVESELDRGTTFTVRLPKRHLQLAPGERRGPSPLH